MKSTKSGLMLFIVTCIVTLNATSANDKGKAEVVTFNKDIAPIFNARCVECHRPGETAPFSTLTYKDVRPWAKSIKEKVLSREMPPWHADPHFGEWANDRRLSEAEIKTIVAWVNNGAVEGNPKDLPPAPKFVDGWQIPTPDLVLTMDEEYVVAATGPDEYHYFDVPTNFTEDKYVQMAEARPGNRKVVHHIIASIIPPGQPTLTNVKKEMRAKVIEMALAGTPWYREGMMMRTRKDTPVYDNSADIPIKLRGFNDVVGFLAAYAPGRNPDVWPPGTAKKIPAGSTIRIQVHYSKVTGAEQKDRSMVGLIFTDGKPPKTLAADAIANMFFKIPAHTEKHKVTAEWTAWRDTTLYSMMPHMHYRGVAMEYKVTYPDGKSEILLNVPNYSFAWQSSYIFKTPKRLPKGSRVTVTGCFDNSAKNKFNPDPSQEVRFGEPTYDEMMMGFIDYVSEWPAPVNLNPQTLDEYVGKYDLGQGIVFTIVREGDKLIVISPKVKTRFELQPIGKDKLRSLNAEIENEITIIRNDKGEVVALHFESNRRSSRARKL
jgi:hypothetical protein